MEVAQVIQIMKPCLGAEKPMVTWGSPIKKKKNKNPYGEIMMNHQIFWVPHDVKQSPHRLWRAFWLCTQKSMGSRAGGLCSWHQRSWMATPKIAMVDSLKWESLRKSLLGGKTPVVQGVPVVPMETNRFAYDYLSKYAYIYIYNS